MHDFFESENDVKIKSIAYNVESRFFDAKPVYLDKIFFDETFLFPHSHGVADKLTVFLRYQDYALEYLRLKILQNYFYVSQGRAYHSLYHYNMYTQFRVSFLFFRLPRFAPSQRAFPCLSGFSVCRLLWVSSDQDSLFA